MANKKAQSVMLKNMPDMPMDNVHVSVDLKKIDKKKANAIRTFVKKHDKESGKMMDAHMKEMDKKHDTRTAKILDILTNSD